MSATCLVASALFSQGCRESSSPNPVPVVVMDTTTDLHHEHKHFHEPEQRHGHLHEDDLAEQVHTHAHRHAHRHDDPPHGGQVVSLQLISSLSEKDTDEIRRPIRPHLEIVRDEVGEIYLYPLAESAEGELSPWDLGLTEIQVRFDQEGEEQQVTATRELPGNAGFRLNWQPTSGVEGDGKYRLTALKVSMGKTRYQISESVVFSGSGLDVVLH